MIFSQTWPSSLMSSQCSVTKLAKPKHIGRHGPAIVREWSMNWHSTIATRRATIGLPSVIPRALGGTCPVIHGCHGRAMEERSPWWSRMPSQIHEGDALVVTHVRRKSEIDIDGDLVTLKMHKIQGMDEVGNLGCRRVQFILGKPVHPITGFINEPPAPVRLQLKGVYHGCTFRSITWPLGRDHVVH